MEVADIITLHFTPQGLLADLEELQLQLATMGFIEVPPKVNLPLYFINKVLKPSSMEIIEHEEEVLLNEDLTEEV
jgi:hypothetical protein